MRARIFLGLALLAAACSSTPPPNWAQGGSPLELPRARWERSGQLVDIMPDGRVLLNGAHIFSIDREGRVIDNDSSPIAVLQADGTLVGKGNTPLGNVGLRNAAAPKGATAWLAIGEGGEVKRFRENGEDYTDGKWTACGEAVRTCTLTTQLVALVESRKPTVFPALGGPTVGFTSTGAGVVGP